MSADVRTEPARRRSRYFWPGLTKGQRNAFEAIATGQQPNMRQSVRDALLAYGLIQRAGTRYLGQVLGHPITAQFYEVPLDVHMQWCEWCDQNIPDEALL